MGDPTREIIEHIDRRLATMERAPGSWGSAESLELQALLLLELRTFVLRPRSYAQNPFEARDEYIRFVSRHFPSAPALLMSSALQTDRLEHELPKLISSMRQELTRKLTLEDPFTTNDLVVELGFRQPDAASFRSICNYFLRFVRAVEALLSGPVIAERRSPLLRWALPRLRAGDSPAGGAVVWLVFDHLRWKRGTQRRFLDGFVKCLQVIEWAAGVGEPTQGRLRHPIEDKRERDRIGTIALRLYPRGRVTHVRIGGDALHRAPVMIEAKHTQRAHSLLAPTTFGARSVGTTSPSGGGGRVQPGRLRIEIPHEWSDAFSKNLPSEPPRLVFRAGAGP